MLDRFFFQFHFVVVKFHRRMKYDIGRPYVSFLSIWCSFSAQTHFLNGFVQSHALFFFLCSCSLHFFLSACAPHFTYLFTVRDHICPWFYIDQGKNVCMWPKTYYSNTVRCILSLSHYENEISILWDHGHFISKLII